MTRGFKTIANHKMLYYMLEHPLFVQRQMAYDLGWKFGEKVNSFVKWLEGLKFVRKTFDPKTGKPAYEVPSRTSLLNFYSSFRNMTDEKIGTYKIGRSYESVRKYLNDNGAIMCLGTALAFYDDYFRDPQIHAYAKNRKLSEIVPRQQEGDIQVSLYAYDFADEVKEINGIRITSPTRTIMDLYCNNMAYAAERLILKEWKS